MVAPFEGISGARLQSAVRILQILQTKGPMPRVQLEELLDVSRPTVTRVVGRMIEQGLVEETERQITAAGRRPVLLRLRGQALYAVGVHIKSSAMYACVTDLAQQIVFEASCPLPVLENAAQLEAAVLDFIGSSLARAGVSPERLLCVGIASRGIVDNAAGSILRYNDAVHRVDIGRAVTARYGCSCFVENNLIINIQGASHEGCFVYFYMDEGIGCIVIHDGQVIRGANHLAGKISHMRVYDGTLYARGAGEYQSLETYASTTAMVKEYAEKRGEQSVTLSELCRRAREAEPCAREVLHSRLKVLAQVLTNIIEIVNPDTLLLHGKMLEEYPAGAEFLKEEVKKTLFLEEMLPSRWALQDSALIQTERAVAKRAMECGFEELLAGSKA